MGLTCYCKKCNKDVPAAEICEACGGKLALSQARAAWCIDRKPVLDWISWNAIVRVGAPVGLLTLALVLLLETTIGGWTALVSLLTGSFLPTLGILLAVLAGLLALILWLQGDEVLDCVVDSKGVHVQYYLPEPNEFKLLLRLKPRRLMNRVIGRRSRALLYAQQELLWKDVQRVQLWPEKNMVLFYAPAVWLRVAVPCTPFTWDDTLGMIRDKLGKKKNVMLPRELREEAPPKQKKKTAAPKAARASRHPEPFQTPREDAAPEERPHARRAD